MEAETTLYEPFLTSALAMMHESGMELKPYPVDDDLREREAVTGRGTKTRCVHLHAQAYRADKIRQVRLVHIQGENGLQVLNFCIFPELEYALPSFAADLVTLPGGHLIALDWAPNGVEWTSAAAAADHGLDDAAVALMHEAFERHREALPGGGPVPPEAAPFFSSCFLFARFPRDVADSEVRAAVLPAYEDYLRHYLQLVASAKPLDYAETRASVRQAQLEYQHYRADKDPARGMLTSLFGAEFTERLIHEVLFDLPLQLNESRRAVADES